MRLGAAENPETSADEDRSSGSFQEGRRAWEAERISSRNDFAGHDVTGDNHFPNFQCGFTTTWRG